MRIRLPYHAGAFYPAKKEALLEEIRRSFLSPLGPGRLPEEHINKRLSYGFLVPHAGYMYSGPIAAHAYFHMARERPPETIVLVGPNHTGLGAAVSVFPSGAWRTPLGDVEVDEEAVKMLISYSGVTAPDEMAHVYEHSLEVQLPFLQYIYDGKFKMVPVTILAQIPSIAVAIAEAYYRMVEENGLDAILVATSDLNHYEPHEVAVRKDERILERLKEADVDGIFREVEEGGVSACGPAPMATVAHLARLARTRPVVLAHATSGDVTGEKSWVVGYASARVAKS